MAATEEEFQQLPAAVAANRRLQARGAAARAR
jgi:hypothetical protein